MSTVYRGFRIRPEDLEEIDKRAKEHKMTRTDYVVRSALNELPTSPRTAETLARVEERLASLEEFCFGSRSDLSRS